jgi:hypothetical protein
LPELSIAFDASMDHETAGDLWEELRQEAYALKDFQINNEDSVAVWQGYQRQRDLVLLAQQQGTPSSTTSAIATGKIDVYDPR